MFHVVGANHKENILPKFDVSTPEGHKLAWDDYWWKDHAFLRENFQNAHQISDKMWRTNQPSPQQLEVWRDKGIKTIVNLRGDTDSSFTVLEKEACEKLGLNLLFFKVESRGAPDPEIMRPMEAALKALEYPALLHCKSGADRAGFASVFYLYRIEGVPLAEARKQLALKYLHVSAGKTGILGHFWDRFAEAEADTGIEFWDWVDNVYDRTKLRAEFKPTPVGSWLVDRVLGRE
ncbi:MAG: sulfur transferase domain-containing protein [Pseudomonadota bacterium]